MATRTALVLVAFLHGAVAGCGGTGPPLGAGDGPALEARCPAAGEALNVAGATMPPLAELARFATRGAPTFVASDQDVYWVSYLPGPSMTNERTAIEAHGLTIGEAAPRRLWAQERPGNRSIFGKLWASGPDLVWVEFFPSKPPTSGTAYALSRAGGDARILREGFPTTDFNGGLRSLAADDESLFLSPISPLGISAVARTTGEVTSHIARPLAPKLAALEGPNLYWVEGDSLWQSRRDGTEARPLASGLPAVDALAVHDGVAWLVTARETQRLLRVAIQGARAACAASSWPEAGRSADLVAGVGGIYLAITDPSGESRDAVWRIGEEGRNAWRLLPAEAERRVRLLASRPDGLLLALSHPGAWAVSRLPRQP
jgi:hypothetical protein